jgi:TPP-dependent pyruvate/acetoin dehydrogenase alpha subunit
MELISQYRTMPRVRRVDEALADRYPEQQMHCPMHPCIGQEGIPAGVCAALRRDHSVYSNHRAHGRYLAKGGDLNAVVAEIYGRATGCCDGRGSSMHLIDPQVRFMGSTPIVRRLFRSRSVPLGRHAFRPRIVSAWHSSVTAASKKE